MASLPTYSSPNSFQLRLGFRNSNSGKVFPRVYTQYSYRRSFICSFSVNGESENRREKINTNEGERSWENSEESSDSFSEWNSRNTADRLRRKLGFGGWIGVGVSGIILVAGITFASLSLSKRGGSGLNQQMEPLSPLQECLINSDDADNHDSQMGNEVSIYCLNDGIHHGYEGSERTGEIDQSSFPIHDTSEIVSKSIIDNNISVSIPLTENGKYNHEKIDAHYDSLNEGYQHTQPDVVESIDPSNSDMSKSLDSFIDNIFSEKNTQLTHVSSTSDSHSPKDLSTSDYENNAPTEVQLPTESQNALPPLSEMDNTSRDSLHRSEIVGEFVTSGSRMEDFDISNGLKPSSEENFDASQENSHLNKIKSLEIASKTGFEELMREKFEINASDNNKPLESQVKDNNFSFVGVPAPSMVPTILQTSPGKILIPAFIDQGQGQALTALKTLKVIEADAEPSDLCIRREYARWLVSSSNTFSRSPVSKVHPAMYIENITELAFDDVTPQDPDFASIQGLAEAGLIFSKLSKSDGGHSLEGMQDPILFSPESPVSRQDLISWKLALDRRDLPNIDKKLLYQQSGFIDIDKINPDAWPSLFADLSAGDQGIVALAFGYTRLFQPNKPITKAQAAIALATGDASEVVSEELARIEAESMAETAVASHTALVAEVEKDLNAYFEVELAREKEKIHFIEKMAQEAKIEIENLRKQREEENEAIARERAILEVEMEVLVKLRREMDEQLQSLISNKTEIAFEQDMIDKLRKEAESENQTILQLQYDLEVERKALSMARAWAEDEAKRARDQAKALEEARHRWEKHGIKVIVDKDLRKEADSQSTWLFSENEETPFNSTINRAENLMEKLKSMGNELKGNPSLVIQKIIQKLGHLVSSLKLRAYESTQVIILKVRDSSEAIQQNTANFSTKVNDEAKRIAGDWREGMEKITQRFKV